MWGVCAPVRARMPPDTAAWCANVGVVEQPHGTGRRDIEVLDVSPDGEGGRKPRTGRRVGGEAGRRGLPSSPLRAPPRKERA